MKVLILSTNDILGGAARAAYRLYKGLQSQSLESTMLVQIKVSDDTSVIGPRGKVGRAFNRLRFYLDNFPFMLY